MGGRDITDWTSEIHIEQGENTLYGSFRVTLRGYHNLELGVPWDIYASYDGTVPRAELLMRAGVIPPDIQPDISIDGDVPTITVQGYEAIWLMQRKRPRQTLVFARDPNNARRAVASYTDPIGVYTTVTMGPRMTLRGVVTTLAHMAGFRCEFRIEDLPLDPFVMPPDSSYWRQISDLVESQAPYIHFDSGTNTLMITDPVAAQCGVGSTMNLPEHLIKSLTDVPVRKRKANRVIVRIPR